MTSELAQGRNASINVVIVVTVDEEARRVEAPNNYLIVFNIIFTACIGPWTMAK